MVVNASPKTSLYPAALLLILFLFPLAIPAQKITEPRILTMSEAVRIALQHTTELKNYKLEKQAEKSLIISEFNLASPTVAIETGQINSALNDYKVTISQEIDFPMVYVEQVAARRARTEVTSLLSDLKKVELITEVKSVYMEWWITFEKIRLKEKQDSIFAILYLVSNEIENGLHHLKSGWYRYSKELEKAGYSLTYFEEQGFDLSNSMISAAEKSFQAGEINLFQYIFALNEAYSLQLEYLDALNRYNQTVIQISRLLGDI